MKATGNRPSQSVRDSLPDDLSDNERQTAVDFIEAHSHVLS